MVSQAHWQASDHCGPVVRATMTQAYAQGREDHNGGPHVHPSLGQGSGS
jgi:hypothetical protein